MFRLLPDWLRRVLRSTTVAVDLDHSQGAVRWRRWWSGGGDPSSLPCQSPFACESMDVHQLGITRESVCHAVMAEPVCQSQADDLWSYELERVDLERRAWAFLAGEPDS